MAKKGTIGRKEVRERLGTVLPGGEQHQIKAVEFLEKELEMLAVGIDLIKNQTGHFDEFCRLIELSILCAEKLAPYQSPKIIVKM